MTNHRKLVIVLYCCVAWAAAPTAFAADAQSRQLSVKNKVSKGDLDRFLERRMIRVLVPYSRSLYFNDNGRERGLTADLMRDFERYLNKRYAHQLGKRPLTVYIIPTTRDKLLTGVTDGFGDIAAANITVTETRLKIVDFVAPSDAKPVRELVVTGPQSTAVETLDDLSGKTIHVRPSSSYYESIVAFNDRLTKERKAPVKIALLPDELEDEDILEMLNAGLFEIVVVDDWKAKMWAQVLPKVKVRENLVLRAEGRIGWAIRKDSPKLSETVFDFYRDVLKTQRVMEARLAQYHKRVKQIHNNTASEEVKRFEQTIKLFERYGERYRFDPLMLAAQGYQESQLRQEARSHTGAIGVMQVMPATGKELAVGDITQVEPNIHAGTKYMDRLMTRYFPDAKFAMEVRPLFAFASYNAGPGNISNMRREALKRGLNPDKWFNNVELVVAEKIGIETTTYVRNIYKYYIAYKLIVDARDLSRKARENLERKPSAQAQ